MYIGSFPVSQAIWSNIDPKKRLHWYHKGGARRTKGRIWTYKCVYGFRTWKEALQLNGQSNIIKNVASIESRKVALERVLSMERWTKIHHCLQKCH